MHVLAVVVCVAIASGCTRTQWKSASAADLWATHEALVLADDLVIHVKDPIVRDGRLHGRVLGSWKRPAGVVELAGDSNGSPRDLARQLGWEPTTVAEPLDVAYKDIRSARVSTRASRHLGRFVITAIGAGVLVLLTVGLIVHCSNDQPSRNQVSFCRDLL